GCGNRANALLVAALDHQYALIDRIQIDISRFDGHPRGRVFDRLNEQIRRQLAPPDSLLVWPSGRFDPSKATRFNMPESSIPLWKVLGWMAGRNGFRVWHGPTTIVWDFE